MGATRESRRVWCMRAESEKRRASTTLDSSVSYRLAGLSTRTMLSITHSILSSRGVGLRFRPHYPVPRRTPPPRILVVAAAFSLFVHVPNAYSGPGHLVLFPVLQGSHPAGSDRTDTRNHRRLRPSPLSSSNCVRTQISPCS